MVDGVVKLISLEKSAEKGTDIKPLVNPWNTGFGDLIVGEDAARPEKLFKKIFSDLSTSRLATAKGWSREALTRLSAAVDVACWDLVGRTAGLPLWKLLGGSSDEVPAYGTCGYYRGGGGAVASWSKPELKAELQMMLDQGHTAIKIKTGGLPTLEEDMERLCYIREVIGHSVDLMVDVNRAWDLRTAREGMKQMRRLNINPRWLEEPLRWQDDARMMKILKRDFPDVPISGGESESLSWRMRDMIEEGALSICQFDVTMMAGGLTEGRKVAAFCELNHVDVAPHERCSLPPLRLVCLDIREHPVPLLAAPRPLLEPRSLRPHWSGRSTKSSRGTAVFSSYPSPGSV